METVKLQEINIKNTTIKIKNSNSKIKKLKTIINNYIEQLNNLYELTTATKYIVNSFGSSKITYKKLNDTGATDNFDDFTLFKSNAEARTITNTNDSNIDKHIKSIKEIFIDKVNKTIKNNIQIFNILDKNEVNINKKINIYTEKHISPYYISSSDEYCYNNCEVLDKMKYNINSSTGDSNYGSIKTEDECFKICTNNPECKQAIYNKTEKKCYS